MGDGARKVPNAEWVLMYRRGLTGSRIAKLVGAPAGKVRYHLTVARSIEPGLVLEHEALAPDVTSATVNGIARMNELVEFVAREGRCPSSKAASPDERSLGQWLLRRRRDAVKGILSPVFREGLRVLPDWEVPARILSVESRWQEQLSALADYRERGEDWPRHKMTASNEEHGLGVWLHSQRYKLRRGELDLVHVAQLDATVPGWRQGRRRGRKPSGLPGKSP